MARLLVVDDDVAIGRMLSLALGAGGGHSVEVAANGTEALSLLLPAPDLIILDLAMPVMDGRTFYRLAREAGFLGPVIICSAFGAAEAKQELGAEGFISKPFDPATLLVEVSAFVGARPTQPS